MKKNISFTLPAEALQGANKAVVLGDFNNWEPTKEFELKKQKDGSFKTTVSLDEGKTYQYRFLLDDNRWVNDYHAQEYVPSNGYGIDNCLISVPREEEVSNYKASSKEVPTKKASAKNVSVKPKKAVEIKAKKTATPVAKKAKPVAGKAKSTTGKVAAKKIATPAKSKKKVAPKKVK